MITRNTNVQEVLASVAEDFEIDDRTILREGWRRFEKELAATVADMRQMAAACPERIADRGHHTPLDRLEAVGDLHRLLRAAPEHVHIHEHVAELVHTLTRCSLPRQLPPIEMDLMCAPVDGRVCRGISLMLVALIAGELAGGPVLDEGVLEIELTVVPGSIEIRVRDLAMDPPDRIGVGGRLLERVATSLGARVDQCDSPGISTVAISVPVPMGFPWRTVGNA
ncbi:MAG: hypothetical protein V4472_17585 [Pseudomonadota bacterium]